MPPTFLHELAQAPGKVSRMPPLLAERAYLPSIAERWLAFRPPQQASRTAVQMSLTTEVARGLARAGQALGAMVEDAERR